VATQIAAPGELDPRQVSLHLPACDVMVQPYPDGVTTRRTTLMAALAHSVPTVTNLGSLSDPIFAARRPAALAAAPNAEALISKTEALLADEEGRAALGRHGRALYEAEFSFERVVARLLQTLDL